MKGINTFGDKKKFYKEKKCEKMRLDFLGGMRGVIKFIYDNT